MAKLDFPTDLDPITAIFLCLGGISESENNIGDFCIILKLLSQLYVIHDVTRSTTGFNAENCFISWSSSVAISVDFLINIMLLLLLYCVC